MRVQPVEQGALQALSAVLQSIESVRNASALYLLLLAFAGGSLMMTLAQGALARESAVAASLWLAAAFFSLFYASNAAGLVLMDEACGRAPRLPIDALRDAMRTAHRLLVVVSCVLLAFALLLAVVLGLLLATRLLGAGLLGAVVALGVPVLGLAGVALLALVGPLAAPAVWAGLDVRQTLRLLQQQVRQRFVHALMLSAAVSLLTATVAALVSVVVLAGARALLALAVGVLDIDLAPQPFLAALFGQGLRMAPGAPALSAATQSALTGAGLVFALGLVVPGVVYLRGLCELFLALRRSDDETPATP